MLLPTIKFLFYFLIILSFMMILNEKHTFSLIENNWRDEFLTHGRYTTYEILMKFIKFHQAKIGDSFEKKRP